MNRIIKNLILVLFLVIASFGFNNAEAADCEKNPIYCHIKRVRPNMDNKKAMKISNLMYKYSRKYKNKNPILSVAIAMQETRIRRIERRQTIIVFTCRGELVKEGSKYRCLGKERAEYVEGYSDISIFQFHALTIKRLGLDPVKLKNNLEYAVEQHFKLMKKKLKICKHLGDEAWSCYHSTTPNLRKRYKKDVERYL